MSDFKDQIFSYYIDVDKLITMDKNPSGKWSGGNELLTTACAYTIMALRGEIFFQDTELFIKTVNACWVNKGGFLYEGLLSRNPDRPDFEGYDDYHIATASHFLNTDHARKIQIYGEHNKWCFDNTLSDKTSLFSKWFGRYPGFPGYIRLAAGDSAGLSQGLLISLSMIANAYSNNPSEKIKGYLQYLVIKDVASDKYKKSISIWENKFKNQFGTLSKLFSAYGYKPYHPFVQLDSFISV